MKETETPKYPKNFEFWDTEDWFEATDIWGDTVTVVGVQHTICKVNKHNIGEGWIVKKNDSIYGVLNGNLL